MTPTLTHLEHLVAFDTTNPPRAIYEGGLFAYLRGALPGFAFQSWNHGNGCISLLATRGAPRLLFNFHIDTVPVAEGWSGNPFALVVDNDRAVGLGACDIKGASACMLAACARTTGPVALLFTSDEEAGSSLCIKRWLENDAGAFDQVLVAEPTRTLEVVAHRGIATCTGTFTGVPGHASADRALADSAVHEAVRWATRALAAAEAAQAESFGALHGIRFNLGRIEGGVKPNMIAGETVLRFGVRPLPNQDPMAVLERLWALAPNPDRVSWEAGFIAPPLRRGDAALPVDLETDSIEVDFWTEAALFSAAGYPTVVYGPGDIAQAHTVGEWVALDQLAAVTETYARLIGE